MYSDAYLSQTFVNDDYSAYTGKNIMPVSLVAYDRLFIDQRLDDIAWVREAFENMSKSWLSREKAKEKYLKDTPTTVSGVRLADLLGGRSEILKYSDKFFFDIRKNGNPEIRQFFDDVIGKPRAKNSTPLFFPWLCSALEIQFPKLRVDEWYENYPWMVRHSAVVFVQEIFIIYYLAKKHRLTPILSVNDLEIRKLIWELQDGNFDQIGPMADMPIVGSEGNIPKNIREDELVYLRMHRGSSEKTVPMPVLLNKENRIPLRSDFLDESGRAYTSKYVRARTLDRLLWPGKKPPKAKIVSKVLDVSVPDLKQIPLAEIAKLKAKDKFKSIAKLSEDLISAKHYSRLDIANFFVDELWKMGKTLSPSIADLVVAVLGNLPLPVQLNPIGILDAANSFKQYINFKKDYAWYITISDLQTMSSKHKKQEIEEQES